MFLFACVCRCQRTSSMDIKTKLVKPSLEELHEDKDHVVAHLGLRCNVSGTNTTKKITYRGKPKLHLNIYL